MKTLAALTLIGIALHVADAPQAWSLVVAEIKAPLPPRMPPEPPHKRWDRRAWLRALYWNEERFPVPKEYFDGKP